MILTQCAVCATDLGLSLGKKCGRCSTRYCGAACQVQHWKEGGHDQLCKKIKKAGGAEQYNANQKYTEAVSVAVEKCAEDTKGQTCYICTEAVHRHTGEGLVRGCACHTTEGFVHVSCLAEQAELLVAELTADDLDLDDLAALGAREGAEAALKVLEQHIADDERSRRNSDVRQARWDRWSFCNLCGQRYHGVVQCALGWACWKTYLGRPGTCWTPIDAMTLLGLGLAAAHRHEEHLVVVEAQLAIARRAEAVEQAILNIKDNVANCYRSLGRQDEALAIRRAVYARSVALSLPPALLYLRVLNLSSSLQHSRRHAEAKAFLLEQVPKARRALGEVHELYLKLCLTHGQAICFEGSREDVVEGTTLLEELSSTTRRIYGPAHPFAETVQRAFVASKQALVHFDVLGSLESHAWQRIFPLLHRH